MTGNGSRRWGRIVVDRDLNQLRCGSQVVQIEPRAMQVLWTLLEQPGQVVRRETIFRRVWGDGEAGNDTLNRLIFDLRGNLKQLDPDAEAIETIRRVGYRLIEREPARRNQLLVSALILLAGVMAITVLLKRDPAPGIGRISPFSTNLGLETYPAFDVAGSSILFGCSTEAEGGSDSQALCGRAVAGSQTQTLLSIPAVGVAPHPDGVHLAFQTPSPDCQINRFNQQSRQLVTLAICRERNDGSLAWSADGQWLFFSDRPAPGAPFQIMAVPFAGSEPVAVTRPPVASVGDLYPTPSPSGNQLAFFRAARAPATTTYITPGSGEVYLAPISQTPLLGDAVVLKHDSGDSQITGLTWWGENLLWFGNPNGRSFELLSAHSSTLSPRSLGEFTGIPRHPTVNAAGLMVAESWNADADLWLASVEEERPPRRILSSTRFDLSPSFSPDGRQIVWVSSRSGRSEIYVGAAADNQVLQKIDPGAGFEAESPRFSPDGSMLVFERRQRGRSEVALYELNAGSLRVLDNPTGQSRAPAFASDGKSIFVTSDRNGRWEIWRQRLADDELALVTRGGGYGHASNNQYLIFSRRDEPGLWRQSLKTGEKEKIWDALPTWSWGNWALVNDEVWAAGVDSSGDPEIVAIHIETLQQRRVLALPQPLLRESTNLAVAPDGRTVIFALRSFLSADLIQFQLQGSFP